MKYAFSNPCQEVQEILHALGCTDAVVLTISAPRYGFSRPAIGCRGVNNLGCPSRCREGVGRQGSKQHSLQAVELSWRLHTAVQIVSKHFTPAMGEQFTIFWQAGHADPLLLIKAGDVETNPGPITTHKQVWICDICHKQMHGRKHISIRCNRIEHLVHLRCTGIHLAQYTDTWTCHLHKEYGFTNHTDITPPHPPDPGPSPLHTYTTAIQTHVQHSPCSHRIGKA